jgi:glutamate-1-semialdehyde 2,1-aminomutase
MKVLAIVQARMGSVRLPGKVMRDIEGRPMIGLLLDRLARSETITQIAVATPQSAENDRLISHVQGMGYPTFAGSERDVLDRFYQAAAPFQPDIVVRITGDCPLVDPALVDTVVRKLIATKADYVSNVSPPTFPDGLDVEAFTFRTLETAWRDAKAAYDREHVTPFIYKSHKFRTEFVTSKIDYSHLRWTVDEPEDLTLVSSIFRNFHSRTDFGWQDIISFINDNKELAEINRGHSRNEGGTMNSGQKLWKRAKQLIPGGSMLLSKRSEMFLPDQWPAYFSRAKGCEVWDLDGNRYIDMSLMGVGTNLLGYGDPEVDAAVQQTVAAGNMSTLNCPEEVYLAEKLVEIHPWAAMVRFARSGGEANAIAIRIARAASGREKVAFCGYHGWHDWYLSANLRNDNQLAEHLLPGLEPAGVAKSLLGSAVPFNFNRFDELEAIVAGGDVGVIKMEVSRNTAPKDNFLGKVRELATRNNIVLIFDECTSGFRQTFGGLHKLYGVEPDLSVFGKTLGNGYAITGVIGRREIMEAAQSTFISSTFWTERIGPSAGLKSLEVMERIRSWDIVTNTGLSIRQQWQQLADRHGLSIEHWGLPALCGFTIKSPRALEYKTLITQEMLKKGYLAGNSVYACTAHTADIIQAFIEQLDPVFGLIRECEDGRDVLSLLNGPVAHTTFKRLN